MYNFDQIEELICTLTADEKQLLKDTIRHGAWGDTECDFLDENDNIISDGCYGYCTNDAHLAGHFRGRQVSRMFLSIYKKLCRKNGHTVGSWLTHYNDWWGDGSGDMLFIRHGFYHYFDEWADSK